MRHQRRYARTRQWSPAAARAELAASPLEIIETVHARRAPMIAVSASLRL
jgi:hypothetical protein